MHTFEGKSCRIHYNSDMSGEVHICDKNSNMEIEIEAQDILDFVADYVRVERIGMLEQMSTDSILHLK